MGFRQLREYYHKKYYSSEINQNEAGQLVPDLFAFQKSFIWGESGSAALSFDISG